MSRTYCLLLPQDVMKLQQSLKEFVEWGSSGHYATSTISTYETLIKRFIKFRQNKDIEDIDILDITAYYQKLKLEGYCESSIAYMMISLRQFFKFFCLRRLCSLNYELISIPKYVSKPFPTVEAAEARRMIRSVRGESFISLRDRTILSFLFASGVRVSELCDLQLSDLHAEKPYAVIISKKNRKRRMIFWDEATGYLLKKYLIEREEYAISDNVFISMSSKYRGQRLTTRSVQRIVSTYRSVPSISPHSFRHAFGVWAVKTKTHPALIQRFLGHKNMNSQQVYEEMNDEDLVHAYQKIAAARH